MLFLRKGDGQLMVENRIKELSIINEMALWIGLALMTAGTFLGAVWANVSWGRYWGWDPKETWAAVTWLSGLAYIHLRLMSRGSRTAAYLLLLLVFAGLQMCWYGVDLLPSAQESMHVYGR